MSFLNSLVKATRASFGKTEPKVRRFVSTEEIFGKDAMVDLPSIINGHLLEDSPSSDTVSAQRGGR
jgi:hypothetical protein